MDFYIERMKTAAIEIYNVCFDTGCHWGQIILMCALSQRLADTPPGNWTSVALRLKLRNRL